MGRHRVYANATERQRAHRAEVRAKLLGAIPVVHGEYYTLYQGDARTIVPLLTGLDVLITDPPYGVLGTPDTHGRATKGTGGKHGLVRGAYASYADTYANLVGSVVPLVRQSLRTVQRGAVFTGPHVWDMPRATVIGRVDNPAGKGLGRWGFETEHHVLFYGVAPDLHKGARFHTVFRSTAKAEPNGHPCPKPLPWMRWLVAFCAREGEVVLDPFMGSGTTGVACLEYGRRFVGIECDPGYFQIACERLAQSAAQGRLFAQTRPTRQALLL